MSTLQADRLIAADPEAIISVLVNVAELAEWNPAITYLQTEDTVARAGYPYVISTRVPGRASLVYTRITDSVVEWELAVSGGAEVGTWVVQQKGRRTRVTHEMRHSGPTFAVLSSAMRKVPGRRLERLQARVEAI